MIAGRLYKGTSTDLWSSGIVLFFMLCGHLPFEDKNSTSLYKKILKANETIKGLIPEYLSEECKNFLIDILNTNPKARLRIKEIKAHPWLALELPEKVERPKSRAERMLYIRGDAHEGQFNEIKLRKSDITNIFNKTFNTKYEDSRGKRNLPMSCNVSLNASPKASIEENDFCSRGRDGSFVATPLNLKDKKMKVKQKYLTTLNIPENKTNLQELFSPVELPFINQRKIRRNQNVNRSIGGRSSFLSANASPVAESPLPRELACHTSLDHRVTSQVNIFTHSYSAVA